MFNQAVLDKMWANSLAATLAFIWSQACVHMMNVKSSSRSPSHLFLLHTEISVSYSHSDSGDWLCIHTCMTVAFLVSSMLHATASLPITIATWFCLEICCWSYMRRNNSPSPASDIQRACLRSHECTDELQENSTIKWVYNFSSWADCDTLVVNRGF